MDSKRDLEEPVGKKKTFIPLEGPGTCWNTEERTDLGFSRKRWEDFSNETRPRKKKTKRSFAVRKEGVSHKGGPPDSTGFRQKESKKGDWETPFPGKSGAERYW